MGEVADILKSIREAIMCVICDHLERGIVSEYDALIWAVELKSYIGEAHLNEIKTHLTKPKVKKYEDLEENESMYTGLRFIEDD